MLNIDFAKARFIRGSRVLEVGFFPSGEVGLSAGGINLTAALIGPVPEGYVAVKNYSECEGVPQCLIDAGVIEAEAVDFRRQGFVTFPIHKLTEKFYDAFPGYSKNTEPYEVEPLVIPGLGDVSVIDLDDGDTYDNDEHGNVVRDGHITAD